MMSYRKRKRMLLINKQQGNILVMFTVGLFVLLAMAALAIDGGHLLLHKSRLQNLSDAAALYAAKTLDDGGSQSEARAAAIEVLRLNLAYRDNFEINEALDLSAVDASTTQVTDAIRVDFSMRPDPFVSDSSADARYVKVDIRNLNLNNFLADVMNFSKQVSTAAVAGPSTRIVECPVDLVPMLVCANDPSPSAAPLFGLELEKLYLMKIGSNNASPIGPGNFQLIRLGDNSGGDDIRDAMAGEAYSSDDNCAITNDDGAVPTEPGNKVGPSGQGINTRLGSWHGPVNSSDHPRDWNICQGPHISLDGGEIEADGVDKAYRYSQYLTDSGSCDAVSDGNVQGNIDSNAPHENERRVLNVVIGDCTDKHHGADDIPYLGLGCFFLTQEMTSGGQNAYIIGEFIKDCYAEGVPEGIAEDKPGPYKIVLYHVPESKDS